MKQLCLLLLSIISISAQAQFAWQKSYGTAPTTDYATQAIESRFGGYILLGSSLQPFPYKGFITVVRTDYQGNVRWMVDHDIGYWDYFPQAICEDSAGNMLIVGGAKTQNSFSNFDAFALKIDSVGGQIWIDTIKGPLSEQYNLCVPSNDGNFVIGARLKDGNHVLKYDNNSGNIIWDKIIRYNTQLLGSIRYIINHKNEYWIFLAHGGFGQTRILRINENGDTVTAQSKACPFPPHGVTKLKSGELLLSTGGLTKLSAQGDTIWTVQAGALAAAELNSSHYITFSHRYDPAFANHDLTLTLVDSSGTILKDTVIWRAGYDEQSKDIFMHPDGDYVCFGQTDKGQLSPGTPYSPDMIMFKFHKWAQGVGRPENSIAQIPLHAWPNPCQGQLQVKAPATGILQLRNLQGVLLLEQSCAGEQILQLDNLPAGIYFLTCSASAGTRTMKIVKQ